MEASPELTIVWAGILAFAVFAYVVLDGFDLGIGILFFRFAPGAERDRCINSIAPVWDGNETWLVMGGGGLMAAFPLAYAVLMPAVYVPVIAMLLALIFRGVAFEFRWRTERMRRIWDLLFSAGSVVAAFCQGVILGAILQGVENANRAYAGGWWDWLTPFSVLTGASVVVGYALLGAGWLIMKTDGNLQARARRLVWPCLFGTLAAISAVSLATPFLDARYAQRWFEWPVILLTAPVPLLVAAVAALAIRSLQRGCDVQPFVWSLALFLLTYAGLGISVYPYAVPETITLWEAAAPASSQLFIAIGAAILLPIILGYTGYAYWVFRGKVTDDGYH